MSDSESNKADSDVEEVPAPAPAPAAPKKNTPTTQWSQCEKYVVDITWLDHENKADSKFTYCFLCQRATLSTNDFSQVTVENGPHWKASNNNNTTIRRHFDKAHSTFFSSSAESDVAERTAIFKEIQKFHQSNNKAGDQSIAKAFNKTRQQLEFDLIRTRHVTPKLNMKLNDVENLIYLFIKGNTSFSKLRDPVEFAKDWKSVWPGVKVPEICHGNHRQKIADFALKTRQLVLSHFAQKDVTLITDKGRIWFDYLPLCVVDAATGDMMLYDLVHIDKAGAGDIADSRAETMARVVQAALTDLKKRTINVLALCTDNASNMTKLGELISSSDQKLVTLGCMCHGIALTHNDSIAENDKWNELIARASDLRKHLNASAGAGNRRPLPEANDTRWNSKLRLSRAVVNKVSRAVVNKVSLKIF